jgi:hypothetical protein
MSKQTEITFTSRSAASLRRQADLEAQRANVREQTRRAKKTLAEEEAARDRYQANIRRTGGTTGATMSGHDDCLLEIKKLNLRLESLAQMEAELDANIEAEKAIPANRAKVQGQLAELLRERHESDDTVIEKLRDGLRTALARRDDHTKDIKALATEIELEADFDESRFATLAAAISPILPASRRWLGQFLGQEAPGLVRAVARMAFELPETLHHSGPAQPGDELLLTEAEFAALSVSSFSLKVGDSCFTGEQWKYFTARRVVSAEQAERDRAVAQQAGLKVTDYWEEQDARELDAAEKARALECSRRAWDNTLEHVRSVNGISLEDALYRTRRDYGPRP